MDAESRVVWFCACAPAEARAMQAVFSGLAYVAPASAPPASASVDGGGSNGGGGAAAAASTQIEPFGAGARTPAGGGGGRSLDIGLNGGRILDIGNGNGGDGNGFAEA